VCRAGETKRAGDEKLSQSIIKNTVAIWENGREERSFLILASFRLSHRVFQTCSFAEASPKSKKSSLQMATEFFQTLYSFFRNHVSVFIFFFTQQFAAIISNRRQNQGLAQAGPGAFKAIIFGSSH
jgi:hypothetical protein